MNVVRCVIKWRSVLGGSMVAKQPNPWLRASAWTAGKNACVVPVDVGFRWAATATATTTAAATAVHAAADARAAAADHAAAAYAAAHARNEGGQIRLPEMKERREGLTMKAARTVVFYTAGPQNSSPSRLDSQPVSKQQAANCSPRKVI